MRVDHNGNWQLNADSSTFASGTVPFSADTWHNLKLRFSGKKIIAIINGMQVGSARDVKYSSGMAGVGSGWNNARFDNFTVQPFTGPLPTQPSDPRLVNLALGNKARASSQAGDSYSPDKANDGDSNATRWCSAAGTGEGQWMEIDFGKDVTLEPVITREFRGFITKYKIQYWDGSEWKDAYTGGSMKDPSPKVDTFTAVTASKGRRIITSTSGVYNSVSIWEFEVYNSTGAVTAQK